MRRFSLALGMVLGATLGVTTASAQLQTTRGVAGSGAQYALDESSYLLRATFGQPIIGSSTAGQTSLTQGFWGPQPRLVSSAQSPVVGAAISGRLKLQATENPFTNSTRLLLNLSDGQSASVVLYDGSGREVRKLLEVEEAAGLIEVQLSADDLSSGHYIVTATTPTERQSLRLVLVR